MARITYTYKSYPNCPRATEYSQERERARALLSGLTGILSIGVVIAFFVYTYSLFSKGNWEDFLTATMFTVIVAFFDAYMFVQNLMFLSDVEVASNKNCLLYEKLPFNTKTYLNLVNEEKVNSIKLRIMEMKKANVPFVEEDLAITNQDLIEKIKVKEQHVSKIKSTLFEMCVEGMIVNDLDVLKEQAKFLNEKLLKILADANKRVFEETREQNLIKAKEVARILEAEEQAKTKALLESEAPEEVKVVTNTIDELKVSKKVAMQSPIITDEETVTFEPLTEAKPEEKTTAKKGTNKKGAAKTTTKKATTKSAAKKTTTKKSVKKD
jgi:hypothetical protein